MEPETSAMASALLKVPLSRSFATYAAHCASTVSMLSLLVDDLEKVADTTSVSRGQVEGKLCRLFAGSTTPTCVCDIEACLPSSI
jgi:hypothetical protein